MKNAIIVPFHQRWRECLSLSEMAQFLMEEVALVGRQIKSHGKCLIETALLHPKGNPASNVTEREVFWMVIDEGLLLAYIDWVKRDQDYQFRALMCWIPKYKEENSPLVESCLKSITQARQWGVTEQGENPLVVESVLFLPSSANLTVIPVQLTPKKYLLDSLQSDRLVGLGIVFTEEGYTAYFDLKELLLYIQDPNWKYSWSAHFYREPTLGTPEFVNYVLVAGEDKNSEPFSRGERRECIMWKRDHDSPVRVIQMLPMDFHYHPYYIVPRYFPKKEWELAIEGCKVILQQDNWEQLFEALCKPNYGECKIDKTWMYLINACYKLDYIWVKETVNYFANWVEGVLEKEEGITSHFIE